jgi:hypothetical protein
LRNTYSLNPGEFQVGNELERHGYSVYLPARDVGIDLLAEKDGNFIRLQVKQSRTYANDQASPTSWTQLRQDALTRAVSLHVDFFIFVVYAPNDLGKRRTFQPYYVIIKPETLELRLSQYRGGTDRGVYWNRDGNHLWETRGSGAKPAVEGGPRDFTAYLNQWDLENTV